MLAIEVIISLIILLGLIFQTGNLAAICMNILTRPRLDIIITDVVFFIILCWFNFQDILSLSVLVSGSSALMIIRNAFATAISLHGQDGHYRQRSCYFAAVQHQIPRIAVVARRSGYDL